MGNAVGAGNERLRPNLTSNLRVAPVCLNCTSPLAGRYCSTCGQDSSPQPTSAARFLVKQAGELLGYDSRLGQTMTNLALRPGSLTRAYLAGHRVRYVAPLSLYLVFAGLFFFLHTLRPFVWFDPRANALRSSLSAVSLGADLSQNQLAHLQSAGVSVDVFAEKFGVVATALLPVFFLASLLLFSAGLWVLTRRAPVSKGNLVHLVFAIHWGSFYLALGCVDRLLALVGASSPFLSMAYTVLSLAYLVVAVWRVYGFHWVVASFQGLVLLFWFYLLLALWLGSVMALATWLAIA